MNKKNPVLKNARKLERDQQKSIIGGEFTGPRKCCEWDDVTGACFLWVCNRCGCP
ncbi:hypothetical protein [Chryseobacterium sp.]|uniref:hypothetical protein n=1 Tax=Chryseobacterium sp. TaxID=1871047 RepID=UPI00321B766D